MKDSNDLAEEPDLQNSPPNNHLLQYSFNNNFQNLSRVTSEIVFSGNTVCPTIERFCKLLCRFRKIAETKRILFIADKNSSNSVKELISDEL